MAEHPPRAGSEDPRDLGFKPQKSMIRWLSPRELVHCGVRAGLSEIFGSYADKRELQGSLPALDPVPYTQHTNGLWIDFVADVGDGFSSTYTIASQLAARELDELGLPRSRILIMGGDQVYPTPSQGNYQNRTLGPYRAALPYSEEGDHPDLYAIPGNHDWYDGLTSFMRVFCAGQWVGGWRTPQTRSYFALELPHRWWLWGIDVQLESYVDEPQLRYFKTLAESRVQGGDSIILCSAAPSWVKAQGREKPEAYASLDYFERTVIRPQGASVRLALTGDSHHYARYENSDGSQKVTAGGGGAYLSATHWLPAELELPPRHSTDPAKTTPPARYRLARTFPEARASKRRRWEIVLLPFTNWSFALLAGAVHLLFAFTIQTQLRGDESFAQLMKQLPFRDMASGIGRSPLGLLLTAAILFGMMGFTKSKVWWKKGLGAVHGLLHIAFAVIAVGLAAHLAPARGVAFTAGFVGLVVVFGGLLGSWLMAIYLLAADLMDCNTNELFAALRIRHDKNFLRMHLGPDGVLTLHPIMVKRTPRCWTLRRDDRQPDYPWFETKRPPIPERIEPAVRIEPAARPLIVDVRKSREPEPTEAVR